MDNRFYILDGHGYIFRSYFGLMSGKSRVNFTRHDGFPTGALYVFASMLLKMYMEVFPYRIVVVFDFPGKNFRNDLCSNYKATRSEIPDDLRYQLPFFRPIAESFGWPSLSIAGVEADDVIASLVKLSIDKKWHTTIFSADKDLMSLVNDQVTVIDSMRQIEYDADKVFEKFGVSPSQVSEWLSLVGDKSDNVAGMSGIGKKTATKLLNEFGSIDNILANTDKLKGKMQERFRDKKLLKQLDLSRKLISLKDDVNINIPIDNFISNNNPPLINILMELGFQSLINRIAE